MRSWIFSALLTALAVLMSPAASAALADDQITVMAMGDEVSLIAIDSPPGVSSNTVDVFPQTATMLVGVPTSIWHYGCSATAAGMIFGYYDRHGYSNMLAGALAPLTYDLTTRNTIIATSAHQTDYWVLYGNPGPDPWEGNWPEHAWSTCTADFMGTNQWKWDFLPSVTTPDGMKDFNTDGSTALFSYSTSALKLYDYIPPAACGLPQTALSHGLRLFVESRGYQVYHDGSNYQNYTQTIDLRVTGGFSFADFMAEIDAGRPLVVGLQGHSMTGVGYDQPTSTVYFHDTWDNNVHSMVWSAGASYGGMDFLNVTCIELVVPEPATISLLGLGIVMFVVRRRRHRS